MTRILAFGLVLLGAAGCAGGNLRGGYDGGNLEPGVATAQEVEKAMGAPKEKRAGPNGETVFWYPRLPYGRVSYAARIGKDGKLIAIEQRLTKENLERLKPGVSREEDVRDLLGPPYRVDWYRRKQLNTWTYQAQGIEPQLIAVDVSKDGVVRGVSMFNDPEARALDGPM
jgi:hypothetical protein